MIVCLHSTSWLLFLFTSHLDGMSSKVDPRLLNRAAYDFPEIYEIKSFPALRHRFKPYVTAETVLKGIELRGKVAIVTGASSGIGKYCVHGIDLSTPVLQ